MRDLRRNKQTVYFSNYLSTSSVMVDGKKTGEKKINYSTPLEVKINVSPATRDASVEPFGVDTDYSHTMITCDMNSPITVNTILWIGITPDSNGEDGTVKHNYVVRKVAKSLNSIVYAIKEVSVS